MKNRCKDFVLLMPMLTLSSFSAPLIYSNVLDVQLAVCCSPFLCVGENLGFQEGLQICVSVTRVGKG